MPSDPTRPGGPRYTRVQRRLLTAVAGLIVAALAGGAYALTYDVLRELALAGRVSRRWAPLYPAMADTLTAMTILSLVITRNARWWTRLLRWTLLLLLVAGGAALSVQHSVWGFSSLPRDPVRAGVAIAPHVMLVIAVWLWLTMFKHLRLAHPAAEEAAPAEPQRGHVKVLEPAAPEPLALAAPMDPESSPTFLDDPEPLIPFPDDPPDPHEPFDHEPTTDDPTTFAPTTHEPATHDLAAHEPTTHDVAAYEPATHDPTPHEPTTHEPAAFEPAAQESAAHEPVEDESPTAASAAHDVVADEADLHGPQESRQQLHMPHAHGSAYEGFVGERSLSSEPEPPPLDALPEPRPSVEALAAPPALLPTDVELVKTGERDEAEERPVTSTTRPDIVMPAAYGEDEDDAPPTDRAEDPDAGERPDETDQPVTDGNPPPSSSFRSGPTPPVD